LAVRQKLRPRATVVLSILQTVDFAPWFAKLVICKKQNAD
jgi:hypothetical protein